jgi:hypothetical protein
METSSNLFQIVGDELPFKPFHNNYYQSPKTLRFDIMQDTYDGIFPRVSDWTRLINRMDRHGVSEYLNWLGGRKKLDYQATYCQVTRESDYDSEATLTFKKPIQVVFGKVGEELITREVTQIKGEFFFDWFWLTNGRQHQKANGFEVFFNCQEFK